MAERILDYAFVHAATSVDAASFLTGILDDGMGGAIELADAEGSQWSIPSSGTISNHNGVSASVLAPYNSAVWPYRAFKNGIVRTWGKLGAGVATGGTARFNRYGGGNGYTGTTLPDRNFYLLEGVNGAGFTIVGSPATGVTDNTLVVNELECTDTQVITRVHDPANEDGSGNFDPALALFTHTYTNSDITRKGLWGLGAYSTSNPTRVQLTSNDPTPEWWLLEIGDSLNRSVHPDGSLAVPSVFDGEVDALAADSHYIAGFNNGISGSKTGDWVSGGGYLTAALARIPKLGATANKVIIPICLGTNDAANGVTASAYHDNLVDIITACLAEPNVAGVILHDSPAMVAPYGGRVAGNALLVQYQAVNAALVNGDTILRGDTQMYAWSVANPSHQGDGIHGDDVFYAQWATFRATALTSALFVPPTTAPTITQSASTVTFDDSDAGVSLYYSTDGTDPDDTDTAIAIGGSIIGVPVGTDVRAIAYKSGVASTVTQLTTIALPGAVASLALSFVTGAVRVTRGVATGATAYSLYHNGSLVTAAMGTTNDVAIADGTGAHTFIVKGTNAGGAGPPITRHLGGASSGGSGGTSGGIGGSGGGGIGSG